MVENRAGPGGPASWRCFIAVAVSDDVRAAARRLQDMIRREGADVALPDPDGMHLTLLFLGDTLTGRIEPLQRAIDRAAAGIAPFSLAFAGLGFFGPPRKPRVVWAGVAEPHEALSVLQKNLLAQVTELGFSIEKRPFRPHLTLGRIRSGRRLDGLTRMVDSHRDTTLGGTPVDRVLLMRSHLDRPRATYSIIHETVLKGA